MTDRSDPNTPPTETPHPGVEANRRLGQIALFTSISCIVPWVIVMMFVPAVVMSTIALVRSVALPGRPGRAPAAIGLLVALGSAALHLAIVSMAWLIGWIGG